MGSSTVQSSIFSLRATCVGNNSITPSKAELQTGIIGSCFTTLHNRGPVSCIWSAKPQLPSPHRARHSHRAPSLSFQTGCIWHARSHGEGQTAAQLSSQGACVRVHADTSAPCRASCLWSPITRRHVSAVRHCCASASCAPSFPMHPYAGSQRSCVQGILAQ